MLKKRIVALVTGIALLAAVVGASTVVADSLEISATPGYATANNTCGSGGGC